MKKCLTIVAVVFGLCLRNQSLAQDKLISLHQFVEKAELEEPHFLHGGYYFVEISSDNGRATHENEECYQVWSVKADSVIPYFAAIAISSTGKAWEISPPQILRKSPSHDPKPKLSLKEAVILAEKYVADHGLVRPPDHLHTAYLITWKDGAQYWHVLSKTISLYVMMDGTIEKTTEM